jgi:hypothetical protein
VGNGRLVRRTTAAFVAALPLVGLAGCGGSDSGSRLSDALDSVSAGAAGQRYFAWSDQAAIEDAGGDLPSGAFSNDAEARWLTPRSVGVQPLVRDREPGRDDLDIHENDQSLLLGLGSEGFAVRLDGAIPGTWASSDSRPKLKMVRVGDHTAYAIPQDEEDPNVRLADGIRFVLAGNEVVAAATDATALTDVLGEGDTPLGDREGYAAAADCLGDVVSATVSPAAGLGLTGATLVATGTRAGDTPTDVLCVVGDQGQASAAAEALRGGLDPNAGEGFTAVEVDTGDSDGAHFARAVVTVPEIGPLGTMTQALADGRVRDWLAG